MKKETKKLLVKYWEPPGPSGKEAFVRRHQKPELHLGYMLGIQIQYISKPMWLLSILLFAGMIAVQLYVRHYMASAVYAMTPFLVAATIAAGMRSYRYGMAELEQTALFSLKSVVMMRMLILGAGNLVLILVLALLKQEAFLEELLYLLVPYLLTAAWGIFCYRRIPGREANYVCLGISILVSLGQMILGMVGISIYQSKNLGCWAAVVVVCILFLKGQIKKIMEQMEDMAWN